MRYEQITKLPTSKIANIYIYIYIYIYNIYNTMENKDQNTDF